MLGLRDLVIFSLIGLSLSIAGCSDLSPSEETQPNEATGLSKTQDVDSAKDFSIPKKPPLPDGVDVAIDCWSIASQHEEHWDVLMKRGWCGRQGSDGALTIDQDVVEMLDFTTQPASWRRHSADLKCTIISLSNGEGSFGYIRKDGRAKLAPFPYDNDCQYLGNGVFVGYERGYAVYYNEKFEPVQRTNYVLADHFYKHLSKVCLVKPTKKYDAYREHFEWVGGQCGYIDENYKVIEAVVHPYEKTPRPKGGIYDGDDPTGFEASIVNVLKEFMENGDKVEAVFIKDGCNFGTSSSLKLECNSKYSEVPEVHRKERRSITEIHLRLEDQTYYRGLVVYYGGPGYEWKRELYWQSVTPIDSPQTP